MPGTRKVLTSLVVDDDESALKLMELYLSSLGHIVITQSDPRNALDMRFPKRPDLVISDIDMPQMNGFDFIKAFREKPGMSGTPVVILTAYSDIGAVRRAAELRALDYLVKPLDKESTLLKLRRVVDRIFAEEVQIDPTTRLSASELILKGTVTAIAETYVRVLSNIQIPTGLSIKIRGNLEENIEIQFPVGTVEECEMTDNGFVLKILFSNIPSQDRERIRTFMNRVK